MKARIFTNLMVVFGVLMIVSGMEFVSVAQADVIYVKHDAAGSNNGTSWTNAYKDLQDALAKARSGDDIWVAKGTYEPGTSPIDSFNLKNGVGVYGGFDGSETSLNKRNWSRNTTVLSGNNKCNHVVSASNVDNTSVLNGFTIKSGGRYYIGEGGGMYNVNSSPTVANCIFTNNSAYNQGGGMYNSNSSPTITNCRFEDNKALIDYETVWDSFGGGMYNTDNSNPIIIDCSFSNNSAQFGGGIYNTESSPTLINCDFTSNTAIKGVNNGAGGGIYNENSKPEIRNCSFKNNTADGDGGGIYNENSTPAISETTLSDNKGINGGGIYYAESNNSMLHNCTLNSNEAVREGGGIFGANSSGFYGFQVINCTFSGNIAGLYGGGIYGYGFHLTLRNCTIVSNSAYNTWESGLTGGGGVFVKGTLRIVNTIIANNDSFGDFENDCKSDSDTTITSFGYNIVEDGCALYFNKTGDVTGEQENLNIGSLADNGGPTQTHALLSGSIAIDAGSDSGTSATDQRGYPRVGKTDIGAYEYCNADCELYCSGTVTLNNGDSYDFAKGEFGYLGGGDFYFSSMKFWANNLNQEGVQDIGDTEDTALYNVNPPQNGYTRFGVDAVEGHTYVSLVHEGGQGGYIIFEVTMLTADSVTVRYICRKEIVMPDISSSLSCPSSVKPGEVIGNNLIFTINNYGDQNAGSFSVGIYISSDSTITVNDTLLINGRETFSSLDVGDSATISKYDLKIPDSIAPGSYYIGVLADEFDTVPECDESNNTDVIPVTVISEEPAIIYVSPYGNGANNGTSWADAYTDLQQALKNAKSGDEIWVAEGIYNPTTETDREATFQLISGVKIYGGFKGTETSLNERDWKANMTYLSGDIGKEGDNSDNSYHVVTGSNTDSTAVMDGFIIHKGGGEKGGGMFNENGSPSIINCIFAFNYGTFGSGIWNGNNSSPVITDCTFSNNTATYDGGGVFNSGGSPVLKGCTFNNNYSLRDGGGMYSSSGDMTITNCTFGENFANDYGGGILAASTSLIVTNCTFVKNVSDQNQDSRGEGGGIYLRSDGILNIKNTLIADNHKGSQIIIPEDCARLTGSGAVQGIINSLGYNIVEHGCASDFTQPGDITGDQPNLNLLADLMDHGGPTQTIALLPDSIAIDAGTDEGAPETDQRGYPRFSPTDIGAFEYQPPPVIYVKHDAAGANDGTSWENAYTSLEFATANAPDIAEIWVAKGTYKPTGTSPDTATFHLKNNVGIYGGFAGTETSKNERDWKIHLTILSGDIGIADDNSDNSYHVVDGSNTDSTAVLDGFTITGGNANQTDSDYGHDKGGGTYVKNGSPKITNCVFSDNTAQKGGGIYNEKSSSEITNCTFYKNTGIGNSGISNLGGGIYNAENSTPLISNCIVEDNTASAGGGIYNWDSSPVITNCTFANNTASTGSGGGMFNYADSSPILTNCTFDGNKAANMGGGMSSPTDAIATVINCTFTNNAADTENRGYAHGGGISITTGSIIIKNTIIANNTKGGDTSDDFYSEPDDSTVNSYGHNIVEYGCISDFTKPGDITGEQTDLNLGELADNGGSTQTCALLPGSIAIDAGTDNGAPETDQRGYGRNGITDIGAFEYNGIPPASEVILGDVDGDNTVDLQDAVLALKAMAGMKTDNINR